MYNYFLLIGVLKRYDEATKTFVIAMLENGEIVEYKLSFKDIYFEGSNLFSQELPVKDKLEMSLDRPIGVRGYISLRPDGAFDLIPTHIKEFNE